jgi:MurNAc alpha-1-phosphate uridylyltransferase
VVRALPHLGEVFWVLAGDVFAPDFVFVPDTVRRFMASEALAHIWLVPNPEHHPRGDFRLDPASALVHADGTPTHTFSTVGLYKRALFQAPWTDIPEGNPQGSAAPLAPLLRGAMAAGRVSGEVYSGAWTDVGTPERLKALG